MKTKLRTTFGSQDLNEYAATLINMLQNGRDNHFINFINYITDSNKKSVLCVKVLFDYIELGIDRPIFLDFLLENINKEHINLSSAKGPVLIRAIQANNVQLVKKLIDEKGADVNIIHRRKKIYLESRYCLLFISLKEEGEIIPGVIW